MKKMKGVIAATFTKSRCRKLKEAVSAKSWNLKGV